MYDTVMGVFCKFQVIRKVQSINIYVCLWKDVSACASMCVYQINKYACQFAFQTFSDIFPGFPYILPHKGSE